LVRVPHGLGKPSFYNFHDHREFLSKVFNQSSLPAYFQPKSKSNNSLKSCSSSSGVAAPQCTPLYGARDKQKQKKKHKPGDADHPAGHESHERLSAREEAGVGSAVAEGHAEALARADGHVGVELARRPQNRQRQQVGRAHHQRLRRSKAESDISRCKMKGEDILDIPRWRGRFGRAPKSRGWSRACRGTAAARRRTPCRRSRPGRRRPAPPPSPRTTPASPPRTPSAGALCPTRTASDACFACAHITKSRYSNIILIKIYIILSEMRNKLSFFYFVHRYKRCWENSQHSLL
jgi:hypothetical protein